LQRVVPYNDTLDQQLQEPLPVGQGRLLQPGAGALAEGLQVRPYFPGGVLLSPEPRLLLALGRQDLPPARDLRATLLQLGEVERLRLVGVKQALLLAVELAQARLPLLFHRPGSGGVLVRLAG